jgi:hypothetical protein
MDVRRIFKTTAICVGATAGLLVALESAGVQAAPKGQVVGKGGTAGPAIIGGSVSQTVFIADEPNSTIGSTEIYETLPGMSTTITIPGDKGKLVIATFGAESACYGGDEGSPDWCVVRVVASDGGPFNPYLGDGTDYAFDSTDNGAESSASWEQHQLTRGKVLKPGIHRIKVQGRVKRFGVATPTFWTGERTLTIQVIDP